MTVRITKDRLPKLLNGVRGLEANRVVVGVPARNSARAGEDDVNNAALAYLHETGSPASNIPARPFLRLGVKAAAKEVVAILKAGAERSLDGRPDTQALQAAGAAARDAVRARISAGVPPALKPDTIRKRRAKGRLGTKPLIDTGQLRRAIGFQVRPKKER